jgi:multidrug efflux pump subunit AcrB
MKNFIKIALTKPYTFVVLAIIIILVGGRSIVMTPTDVFPNIKTPVVAIVWAYDGLLPSDVSGRITFFYERALTSTVEGIEHIESHSYYGSSIVKVFLQPGVDLASAEAEIVAVSQTVVNALPPDISPPMIMKLSASSVPVAMLEVTSTEYSPAELYNIAIARIRPELVTIDGAILPHPYGGTDRQVLVSLDPNKLLSKNMTASEVLEALKQQNLILPAGDEKINTIDWMVQNNASPLEIENFNDIPIKKKDNTTIFLRDVGDTTLGGAPQQNSVLVDGKQAVMIVVMKSSEASTLDVVDGIKRAIPKLNQTLPEGINIRLLNDASKFVEDSIMNVVEEMVLATLLTGLVVLLFIGSLRSTIIISIAIPLSILSSLICLNWIGATINVMTLGGLALAVGILVDNATVMVENIDTHLAMNKPLSTAILDAANQIIGPMFIATLCITVVWLPLFGISGISGWLFKPMAFAIIFAVLASFILAITLVPTMAKYMLHEHQSRNDDDNHDQEKARHSKLKRFFSLFSDHFKRFQTDFEHGFEKFRDRYQILLNATINNRGKFVASFIIICLLASSLLFINGRNFFPEIKSDTLQMHMRAPLGTRIGTTGKIASLVSLDIKKLLPGVDGVISNCGLPVGPHNLAFIPTPTIGSQDCDITVTLKDEESPVWDYRRILRRELSKKYPGTIFTFQPADLTAKILNFGSPSPIDVQIKGLEMEENYAYAKELAAKIRAIPGTKDVNIQQTMNTPTLLAKGDRIFGLGMGLTEKNIAENMILATAGSKQIDQQYWLNHKTGLSYRLNLYTPQHKMTSLNDLLTIPVTKPEKDTSPDRVELSGNVTDISLVGTPGVITHGDIMPLFDIYVSAEGRSLGEVLKDVDYVIEESLDDKPKSASIEIRGQAETMKQAYKELIIGLLAAVILVYLLIVINFQSWLDPFIIITALLGAIAGTSLFLFLTRTTLSVPALTGAIMSIGTATANSILVVSAARERMAIHGDAIKAALEAGHARIRPVIMTASAMIIGMIPMSVSNTPNAPLGRAVIGGLLLATFATLFFVPSIYTMFYHRKTDKSGPLCLYEDSSSEE